MTLSLEQQDKLRQVIKKKEIQLNKKNIRVKSGELWYRAILIMLSGGTFQAILQSLESYPQERIFVA